MLRELRARRAAKAKPRIDSEPASRCVNSATEAHGNGSRFDFSLIEPRRLSLQYSRAAKVHFLKPMYSQPDKPVVRKLLLSYDWLRPSRSSIG